MPPHQGRTMLAPGAFFFSLDLTPHPSGKERDGGLLRALLSPPLSTYLFALLVRAI